MNRPSITGEQLRAQRLEREALELKDAGERAVAARASAGASLVLVGLAMLIVGAFILIVVPGASDTDIVNLQMLYVGQTSAIIGAIFLAAGVHLRNSGA